MPLTCSVCTGLAPGPPEPGKQPNGHHQEEEESHPQISYHSLGKCSLTAHFIGFSLGSITCTLWCPRVSVGRTRGDLLMLMAPQTSFLQANCWWEFMSRQPRHLPLPLRAEAATLGSQPFLVLLIFHRGRETARPPHTLHLDLELSRALCLGKVGKRSLLHGL